ncbi:MAG: hypothetical protein AAGI30_08035 [Planctomycetota bacterium]
MSPPAPGEPPASLPPADALTPASGDIAAMWSKLVHAAERSAATGSALDVCGPGELTSQRFELKLFNPEREGFVRGRMDEIERLVREVAGDDVRVELAVAREDERPPTPVAEVADTHSSTESAGAPTAADIERAMANPLVRKAVDLFEGRIVAVEPADASDGPNE